MSIEASISVNAHFTRSTNIGRDANSEQVTKSYIPTTRALRTLDQIGDAFKVNENPRAWSLIGPYGSGKSIFAVFVSHLLGGPELENTKLAYKVLRAAEPKIAKKLKGITAGGEGYCSVLLTGTPTSFSKSLLQALNERAQEIWSKRRGKNPEAVELLDADVTLDSTLTVEEVMGHVTGIQDALARIGHTGLLIVIDELGKFLEYEARHSGTNDIYLLQALSEHAYSNHKVKLGLMVMMHQSIEQYARGLGESLRDEWAKVQGRFQSVPFIETSEQTLRIVGAAVEHDFTDKQEQEIKKRTEKITSSLLKEKALPVNMDEAAANEIFSACYPLHPVSAILLPILCQKVAQNERTLFSYLGSKEEHGFLDSVKRCRKIGEWIYPWEIFEYFIINQPASLNDHYTHRRWAEVLTALDRLSDVDQPAVQLLKSVGLLNIVGSQGGLKASSGILNNCLPKKGDVQKSIKLLEERSAIQFRKFNGEYRVWQGSDFDLEGRIEDERDRLGTFSIAETINERHNFLPIVARKYTIQNGALRYFTPTFVDRETISIAKKKADKPTLFFFVSESKSDDGLFTELIKQSRQQDLFVLLNNGEQLREVATEVAALQQVENSSQELSADPVAHREFIDVQAAATNQERELISEILDSPHLHQWFWTGEQLEIFGKRSFQEQISHVLEHVYHAAPVLKNELINRDKPSSQANTARNKLLAGLIENSEMEDLGIEKFPAEKGIYRSLLRATGLHYQSLEGDWRLAKLNDLQMDDTYNLLPLWKRIDTFFNSTDQTPRSLIELNKELFAPPYGMKEGVLPLLYGVALLAYSDELAISEEGAYVPHMNFGHMERFLKRPDTFKVQQVRIEGVNREIIMAYSKALFNDGGERSILEIAKPIAKFIHGLSGYAQQTATLSPAASSLRDVFKLSKSPVQLLLKDLPDALGIDQENIGSKLPTLLVEALRELKYVHSDMVQQMVEHIADTFAVSEKETKEVRRAISSRSYGLEKFSVDEQGVRGLIVRVQREQLTDEEWVEGLLMFLGGKPSHRWNDATKSAAEYKLTTLVGKLRDLEKLRFGYEDAANRGEDSDVYLLKSSKLRSTENDEVIVVDPQTKEAAAVVKAQLKDVLGSNEFDDKVAIAALAELVDEVLDERSRRSSSTEEQASLKLVSGGEE